MIDRAYDLGGEWTDDWSHSVLNNKKSKEALNSSIKRWAKKHLEEINFYSVGKSEEYVLTEEDFE